MVVTNDSALSPVRWTWDPSWFTARLRADRVRTPSGCCPAARQVYATRFAKVDFRCCRGRLHEIGPYRPVGGLSWHEAELHGTSLTLIGDSLQEQLFLALLCLAWSEDLDVHLQDASGAGKSWNSQIVMATGVVNVSFVRCDDLQLGLLPPRNLSQPTYLIIGGWRHLDLSTLNESFVRSAILGPLERERPLKRTLLAEALPSHFPGGGFQEYLESLKSYHEFLVSTAGSNATHAAARHARQVCEAHAEPSADRGCAINPLLRAAATSSRGAAELLELSSLYAGRGAAHVGERWVSGRSASPALDCGHYCVAPGVLDAAALATLAKLAPSYRVRTAQRM